MDIGNEVLIMHLTGRGLAESAGRGLVGKSAVGGLIADCGGLKAQSADEGFVAKRAYEDLVSQTARGVLVAQSAGRGLVDHSAGRGLIAETADT